MWGGSFIKYSKIEFWYGIFQVIAMRSFDENNTLKGYVVMDYIPADDVNLSDNVTFSELKQAYE